MRLSRKFVITAAATLAAVPAYARPWNEHQNHLNAAVRQMQMAEADIHHLIEEKRHTQDQAKIAQIMREIAERHRALEKTSKDYEEERMHVRFEHPERADQLEHQYVRHEMRSLEEMEDDVGIDGRLDRVRALVLMTFPIPEKKMTQEEKNFRTRLPASKPETPSEDTPDKVILAK